MDAARFDRLTLSFAEGRSRRGVLASVAAGLAALGVDPGLDAEAKRRKKKGKKKKNKKCKNGKKRCNGKCVNLNKNSELCGSCGNVCPPGTSCQNGSCTCLTECCANSDCVGSEVCQNGACIGGCPNECCQQSDCPPETPTCIGGSCCTNCT